MPVCLQGPAFTPPVFFFSARDHSSGVARVCPKLDRRHRPHGPCPQRRQEGLLRHDVVVIVIQRVDGPVRKPKAVCYDSPAMPLAAPTRAPIRNNLSCRRRGRRSAAGSYRGKVIVTISRVHEAVEYNGESIGEEGDIEVRFQDNGIGTAKMCVCVCVRVCYWGSVEDRSFPVAGRV